MAVASWALFPAKHMYRGLGGSSSSMKCEPVEEMFPLPFESCATSDPCVWELALVSTVCNLFSLMH